MSKTVRPALRTIITVPGHRTSYKPIDGVEPLGYHIGEDGMLWTNDYDAEIVSVRKKRGKDGYCLSVKVLGAKGSFRPHYVTGDWQTTHNPRSLA